jgi:copper resistance protein B
MKVAIALVVATISVTWPTHGLGQTASTSAPSAGTQERKPQPAGAHHHEPAPQETPTTAAPPSVPHATHGESEDSPRLPAFIPPLTDADRAAAFPDLKGHTVHDNMVHYYVLFDQFEWQAANAGSGLNIDSKGWIGRDRDRLWFRAEGDSEDGEIGEAEAHVLYGRQFSRWWDVVAGVRQDFEPGPARTWAAIGVQGLAPYWFEVEATAYVGESGRTHARFEVEYELLLTNRLILQPLVEAEVFGKSDPERGIGAGLSTLDTGLRLRYEFRREFAPYIGVTWNRKLGKTADFAKAAGEETGGARLVTGLRLWF